MLDKPGCQCQNPGSFRLRAPAVSQIPPETIRRRIVELQVEHSDLDALLTAGSNRLVDQLALRRLKKRKLQIKDEIARLGMQLVPDIPA